MKSRRSEQKQDARRRFIEILCEDEPRLDLARAALLIAAEDEPGLQIEPYLHLLDEWGQEARELVAAGGDEVFQLNHYLFDTLGFGGNRKNYHDPRNSYLNRVMERRVGLPITLSLIYLEIAQRAGLYAEGVGMPGHFIVRVKVPWSEESTLVDSFDRRIVTEDDCQGKLDELFQARLVLHPVHLRRVSKKEILSRLLSNLKGVYISRKLYHRAAAIVERIILVSPDSIDELRDGALLWAKAAHWDEALRMAEKYLKVARAASDFTEINELIKQWQRARAALN